MNNRLSSSVAALFVLYAGYSNAQDLSCDRTLKPDQSTLLSGMSITVDKNTARYTLPATSFAPEKWYQVVLDGVEISPQLDQHSIRFLLAAGSNSFRTFKFNYVAGSSKTICIQFRAPAYTDKSQLVLPVSLSKDAVISITQISPLSLTETITDNAYSYAPKEYKLVFNDEFNGSTLNRKKWFTRYIYGGEKQDKLGSELQRYSDDPGLHNIYDGILHLTAKRVVDTAGAVTYKSAMIRSDWTFTYGYLEARVKMPKGKGVWPAFWLNSDASNQGLLYWPPEIDIFEYVNNGKDDLPNMIHMAANVPKGQKFNVTNADPAFNKKNLTYVAPFNFDEGWHTMGASWKPGEVSFYIDGKRIMTLENHWVYFDGTDAGKAHILLNLAIGGKWAGRYGIDDSAFPQSFDINWIRAYQVPAD